MTNIEGLNVNMKELVKIESLRDQYHIATHVVDQQVLLPPVFNYDALDDAVIAGEVRSAAARLRSKLGHHLRAATEIGQELIDVKKKVGHGLFGAWLASEFGWHERTANNHMSLVDAFAGKSEMFADLPLTLAYRIAARSMPPAVREQLLGKVKAGGKITVETVTQMVRAGKLNEQLTKAESALEPRQVKALDKRLDQRRADDDRHRQDSDRRRQQQADLVTAGVKLIEQKFGVGIAELAPYLAVWPELGEVLRGIVASPLDVLAASGDPHGIEVTEEPEPANSRPGDPTRITDDRVDGLVSAPVGVAAAPATAVAGS
jgi:hypothetical protein